MEEIEELFRVFRQRNDTVEFVFYLDKSVGCVKDDVEVGKTRNRQRHLTRVIVFETGEQNGFQKYLGDGISRS